jgi:hypothetical protein
VTPLQVWTKALFSLLGDARAELDENEYSSLVAIAMERIRIAAGDLVVGEAPRATRDASG